MRYHLKLQLRKKLIKSIKNIANKDRNKLIRIDPKKNLIPSLFSFGEKIAKSYLHVHIGLSTLAIAIKNAAIPN